jgi:ribosomal protein S20
MAKNRTPSWVIRRAIKRSVRNCMDKTVYKTIVDAVTAAKKHGQRLYICPICKEYHLTSKMEGY